MTLDREAILSMTFLTLTMTISLIGNSLVILATIVSKNLHRFTNILIFNLSISDLLITSINLPIRISQHFGGDTFSASSKCKISVALTVFLFTSSNMNLLLITFDRFVGTVFPLKHKTRFVSKTTLSVAIFTAWAISLVVGVFPFIIYGEKERIYDSRITVCTFSTVLQPGYVIFIEIGGLIIPWLIMIAMYTKILSIVYYSRHNKMRSSSAVTVEVVGRRKSLNKKAVVQKLRKITNEIRLSKVVFLIVAFYSICMVPIGLIDLIETINKDPLVPTTVIKVALLLAYANSAMNPPIYVASSSKYRKNFIRILCCMTMRKTISARQTRVNPANGEGVSGSK